MDTGFDAESSNITTGINKLENVDFIHVVMII